MPMPAPADDFGDALPTWMSEPPDGAPFDPDAIAAHVADLEADDEPVGDVHELLPEVTADAEPRRWSIEDDDAAEWAAAHLAEATRHVLAIRAREARLVERARSWADAEARHHDAKARLMASLLEHYALRQRAETKGKRKTITLPSGRVTTTETSAKVVVADETAVIEWAEGTLDGPQLEAVVKVTKRALVTGVRDVVTLAPVSGGRRCLLATGEVVELTDDAEPGDEVLSPTGEDTTVAEVLEVLTELRPVTEAGETPPGLSVEPAKITAKAHPA